MVLPQTVRRGMASVGPQSQSAKDDVVTDHAPQAAPPIKLVSQLLMTDSALRDLVEEFVANLDGRLDELKQAYEKLDWGQLTRMAHRLKGAAGSYGYPEISQVCATMERSFAVHEADEFAAWLADLEQLAAAAREGLTAGR